MFRVYYGCFIYDHKDEIRPLHPKLLMTLRRAIQIFRSMCDEVPEEIRRDATSLPMMYVWKCSNNDRPNPYVDIPDERWTLGSRNGVTRDPVLGQNNPLLNEYLSILRSVMTSERNKKWDRLGLKERRLLKKMELQGTITNHYPYRISDVRKLESVGLCYVTVHNIGSKKQTGKIWSATITAEGRILTRGRFIPV